MRSRRSPVRDRQRVLANSPANVILAEFECSLSGSDEQPIPEQPGHSIDLTRLEFSRSCSQHIRASQSL